MDKYSHSVSQEFPRLFQLFIGHSFIARYDRALLAVQSPTNKDENGPQQELKKERMKGGESLLFTRVCFELCFLEKSVACNENREYYPPSFNTVRSID